MGENDDLGVRPADNDLPPRDPPLPLPIASDLRGTIVTAGAWLALAAALLGWMFDGFEQGIFPLVARPALIDLLGLSEDARVAADKDADASQRDAAKRRIDAQVGPWISGITAAFLVGAACGGWFFGWLGDRAGRVRAMVFSVLTYAVFTGLCGLAASPWHLAGLRFLSALGMGGEWSLGVALVMECWPHRKRPLLAGLIGASANVGFILTGLLLTAVQAGGLAVQGGGWRWVLGACVFPAFLTFFLRTFVPESEKWRAAASSGPRAEIKDIFTPDLLRKTVLGTALACVALIGTWGSVQFIPSWVRQMTPDPQMANNAQMCGGLGAVIGSILGALVGVRLGRPGPISCCVSARCWSPRSCSAGSSWRTRPWTAGFWLWSC